MKPRISVKDTLAIIGTGVMFGAGMLVIYLVAGGDMSWAGGLR